MQTDIPRRTTRAAFRGDPCVGIRAAEGAPVARGIAESGEICREDFPEWIRGLPAHRRKGPGTGSVRTLPDRLKSAGARFAAVSGNPDSPARPGPVPEMRL